MNRSLFAFFLAAPVALVACGGAAADRMPSVGAPPPAPVDAPEPQTVEEAQKQIARAEAELNGRALHYKDVTTESKPAEPSKAAPTGGSARKTDDDGASTDNMTQCENPCRALASMKRAVDALCRMTGESDTKCVDAKKTLADNVTKTASCKCG